MGFRKEETRYKLKFEAYDGLEVTVRALSVGELMELTSLAMKSDANDAKASLDKSEKMLRIFADKLVSWNLEDEDGKPVPATLAGIKSQEMSFIIEIITTLVNTVSRIDESLKEKSSTLPTLGSLTTETLN